jgi:hypothetical protein
MNEHFKDQMLLAIQHEIATNPRGSTVPSRVPTKALVSAAAVVAVVAGGLAITQIDRSDDGLVATDGAGPSTTPQSDDEFARGYVFDTPHGRTFRVPVSPMTAPPPEDGYVAFRLADADQRLMPMTVTPSIDTFETHVVEVIGGRELRTPNGMSFPAGMTEENNTGPWMWNEPDGSQWMAFGLLADLRRALPDLAYADGAMVPGPSLVVDSSWPPQPSPEIHRIRDERFEIGISDDDTSTFDVVDPRRGELELVDIGGHPGVRSTGDGISWRVDAHTVISIQRSMATFGQPAPTSDELLAAARSVRPATVAEMKALPVWRGALDERVIVTIPPDLPVTMQVDPTRVAQPDRAHLSSQPTFSLGVRVSDLDDPTGNYGFSAGSDESWSEHGFALPVGPERIGHRLQLTLEPAERYYGELPAGKRGCTEIVTVPPEGAEPVTVHLEANC